MPSVSAKGLSISINEPIDLDRLSTAITTATITLIDADLELVEFEVPLVLDDLRTFAQRLKHFPEKATIQIARLEFEEMHALFETSVPAFSYRNKETVHLTKELALEKDILVTMDAGSNVHLLFRDEDFTLSKQMKNKYSSFQSIASWCEL